jgi:transposase-like protein
MSPSPLFCPYLDCDHKGRIDTEAITVHAYKSREERTPTRYHCAACDRTFSARRCTPF